LQLNIFSALNALNNKKIPTQSISGDAETALILLSALANIDIDLELLVSKYFGDIPALMLRKVISNKSESQKASMHKKTKRIRYLGLLEIFQSGLIDLNMF
jgi:ubiquinone biosynthesis protein UbiJ